MFDIRDPKVDHAQIRINVPMSRNISDIRLQLIKTFEIKQKSETNISGCVILPNGHLLMTNYTKESKLIEYTDTGDHIRDFQVSDKPFGIALLDLDRIVVTYGKDNFIEIMQNDTFNVEKKISFHDSCMGVSQEDGKLYVVSGYKTIQVLDLSGRQLDKLKVASDSVLNITTGRYKLFYTDVNKNIVHCCRFDNEELWQYEDESITYPCAITVDNNSNVYIVGYVSNTLTVKQHEGKKCKTLLSESDDLIEQTAVYYDKEKDILLLCTEKGKLHLCKIV